MVALPYFMLLALVLGIKHSYDSDHLIAVSNILRKAGSSKSAAKVGLSWATGHMLTATIITVLLYISKETFLNGVLPHFEKIIGIVLIALGILSLRDLLRFHSHIHSHDGIVHCHPHIHLMDSGRQSHVHKHMFGIGILHGLASNDELLALFTMSLAVTSLGGLNLALGFFSIGVVLGMIIFALIFSYPLIRLRNEKIYRLVTFGTGSAGLIYGSLMLFAVI